MTDSMTLMIRFPTLQLGQHPSIHPKRDAIEMPRGGEASPLEIDQDRDVAGSDVRAVHEKERREGGECGGVVGFLATVLRPVRFECEPVLADYGEFELVEFEACGEDLDFVFGTGIVVLSPWWRGEIWLEGHKKRNSKARLNSQ
jgi:hypothetical protein